MNIFGSGTRAQTPVPEVASPGPAGGQLAPQNADDRFSLLELRRIYKQLVENKQVSTENQELVVEILRVIAEMVVYGDNKSELLFDFFCEKNMLSLFLQIMWSEGGCPVEVHIQILQTLSILISCVRNDTSLYYLLSNNHVNDILSFPHPSLDTPDTDESLCAQFASFMKTLSLRLNDQTVQFFYIVESGAFPLLTQAVSESYLYCLFLIFI
jgi:protein CLEC16A